MAYALFNSRIISSFVLLHPVSVNHLRQKEIGSRGLYGSYIIPGLSMATFIATCRVPRGIFAADVVVAGCVGITGCADVDIDLPPPYCTTNSEPLTRQEPLPLRSKMPPIVQEQVTMVRIRGKNCRWLVLGFK